MRLFDVRRLRWVDVEELPRHNKVHEGQILERISPAGELYFNYYMPTLAYAESSGFLDLRRRSMRTGEITKFATEEPLQTAAMTNDGHYYFVSATQLVVVIAPDGTVRTFEPMPHKVVQACLLDLDRNVLLSATWGEILLHRVVGDKLLPLARFAVTGNVSWLALEEPRLVACVDGIVRVWHIGANFAIGREEYQHVASDPLRAASLSRDGRFLAIGVDRKVIVHDLDQDVSTELEGHSDDICLVRFVGSDHLLVTADEDNRVILRPRTATGYVRSVIDIDVPDEPIKLELDA